MSEPPAEIQVAVGIVLRRGEILLTRRPPGSHLERLWEFPGGKVKPEETPEECVQREVREETGLFVSVTSLLARYPHRYPDRTVCLHFFECEVAAGKLNPNLQEARWAPLEEIQSLPMPPANQPIVEMLLQRDRSDPRGR